MLTASFSTSSFPTQELPLPIVLHQEKEDLHTTLPSLQLPLEEDFIFFHFTCIDTTTIALVDSFTVAADI